VSCWMVLGWIKYRVNGQGTRRGGLRRGFDTLLQDLKVIFRASDAAPQDVLCEQRDSRVAVDLEILKLSMSFLIAGC
jgi:hypothetical protein